MYIIANVSLSTAVVGVASENEIEVNVSLAIHLYRHFQLKKNSISNVTTIPNRSITISTTITTFTSKLS